jgi:glycosyltransferase involved in cell wall biosynthesis
MEPSSPRRILFVAYHFPPTGGGGVQRNAKFARYLREFGYEPVVITGSGAAAGRWTPTDETLAGDVPPTLEIHRVEGPEPAGSTGWRARGERLLMRRRPLHAWWIEGAVELGLRVGGDCELIYVSLEPYEAGEIGMRLSRALGKPWVADLQDPWTLDEMRVLPSRLHRRLELGRMRRTLGSADAAVMNTAEAVRRVQRELPELQRVTVVSIPNGFDAADFSVPVPARTDDRFRIVHAGYLHTDLGRQHRRTRRLRRLLGGDQYGVDILTRSHVFLIDALNRLRASEPDLADRIDLWLAGVLSAADREVAQGWPSVELPGYLSHGETLELVRTADLLFLPMQNLPAGTRAGLVPGKTYEYLASGRPILAPVPEGDARDLLEASGNAWICDPDDVGEMTRLLQQLVSGSHGRAGARDERADVLAGYERRSLTRDLAAVFDRVGSAAAATRPSGAGS